MNLLSRFGWQIRSHTATRRAPAWVSSYARAAEMTSDVMDSWSALPGAGSYALAAERYTVSDLVYMCTSKLASLASGLQLVLFDPDGERDPLTGLPLDSARIERRDHPFYDLWDRPNPFDSRPEFIEAIVTTLIISPKGVFIHLDDGLRPRADADRVKRIGLRGEPKALWWILPEPMTVRPDVDKYIGGYSFAMAGERTEFATEAIMRITEFNPLNRYNSLSRIVPANLASASDIESQISGYSLFKNGFRPSAIVESDRDQVDPDELKLMEKLWNEQQVGSNNFHKLFPVWAGFKFKEYGITPREAESIPTAKLNRERVFGVIGVHPGLVFSEDTNLASAKVAEHATRAWTLAPMMERIAGEITSILPHWPDAPLAEAHFVNVVPADAQIAAETEKVKAEAAAQRSQAVATLVGSLGPDAGVEVAQAWGLLSDDVEVSIPEVAEKAIKAGSVGERDALVASSRRIIDDMATDLSNGLITVDLWLLRMRTFVRSTFEAQYRLGFGGLDQAGRDVLRPLLEKQFELLEAFANEIEANPDWDLNYIAGRSFLYVKASTVAYELANVREILEAVGGMINLPEDPADGDQICLSRCRCHWRVHVRGRRAFCYWELDPGAKHCDSCKENNEKWSPLILPIMPL